MTTISVPVEIDLADFTDDEIEEEFHLRQLGEDVDLALEALSGLRQRRYLDAQTALERLLYPKWKNLAQVDTAYGLAMSHRAAG
jgi:hypothetical protein